MNIESLFLRFALLGADWVLWLLLVLSVASIAVMIERALFFKRQAIDLDGLLRAIDLAISSNSQLAADYRNAGALEAAVARAGLEALEHGLSASAEAMNGAKARGRRSYERVLVYLGTLGNNAPFLGLFGTVLGVVGAFDKLKTNPEGGIDVVGGDLSQALVATAVGILVALPAVVAFNLFNRRVRSALAGADEAAHAVLASAHKHGRAA